jgi:hypothetical protein
MALDVPPPPADAAPDTSQVDQEAGGEEQTDPMAGDPNALSAGQGNDEISQKYQQLSPDQQKAADKYVDSMLNNDDQAGGQDPNAQMPMESRFNFKHIIDEVFGEIEPTRPLDQGTQRDEQNVGEDAETELQNPFTPGM